MVGAESVSLRVAVVVSESPSLTETSPIEIDGTGGGGGGGGGGEQGEDATVSETPSERFRAASYACTETVTLWPQDRSVTVKAGAETPRQPFARRPSTVTR